MNGKFLVIHYRADSEKVIKYIEVIKAKNLDEAFEETINNFTANIIIPDNAKNKKEFLKLIAMFS